MNKNLLISVIVVVAFAAGVYFVLQNAPEREVINNQSETGQTEQSMNTTQETADQPMGEAPEMVVLKEGTGDIVTKEGDTLSVVYTGYFTDGKVFDSNVESGQAFEFTLGAGQVIAGWDVGLVGMKVGEVRRLKLPPAFAYGSNEVGPIPANSTLVFDVELKAIK